MTERDSQGAGGPPDSGAHREDPPSAMFPSVAWTPPPQDLADDVAPPTAAPVVPPRRGSPIRWAVALLVTVLVVSAGFAGVFLLTGQSAPSGIVGYVPDDAVIYTDIRLDLPGDQRQRLGQFLAKFPGFADQSILDAKLDDVFDRVVRAATHDEQTWTADIEPWFGGEVGFALAQLPDPSRPNDFRGLFVITITDAAKARTWLEAATKDTATTTESYNGADIVSGASGTMTAAYTVVDKVVLLGDVASVKAAVDTKGNSSFSRSDRARAAAAALDDDSIAYVYMDMRRYMDWAMNLAGSQSPGVGPMFDAASLERLPEWVAFRVRARADGLAFESVAPKTPTKVSRENKLSAIAPHLPPSTIAVVEAHDTGTAILETLDLYRTNTTTAEAFKSIDQAAAVLGGFDAIVGWIDQASIVVTRDGTTVGGGLVFTAKDRAAGDRLLTTLRGYAVIAGGGFGVKVTDAQHAGTTVTTIDLGDLRDLGAAAGIPDAAVGGRLTIAYASTPDLIVIGVGDKFVSSVLDAKPGASLADNQRYKAMIDAAGARNVGSAWVDLEAVRELVESAAAASGQSLAGYERDVKPYLEHLDGFVEVGTADGDLNRATMVLVAR